jgi:hypothetical protein
MSAKKGHFPNFPTNILFTIFIIFKQNALVMQYVAAHYVMSPVLQHISALIEPSSGRYNLRECIRYKSIHID